MLTMSVIFVTFQFSNSSLFPRWEDRPAILGIILPIILFAVFLLFTSTIIKIKVLCFKHCSYIVFWGYLNISLLL